MTYSLSTLSTESQTTPGQEGQISKFLKEHSEVEMVLPVILGVFITSRLQLRGANALLVNLAVASIFRQIFIQLKQHSPEKQPETLPSVSQSGSAGYTIVHSVPGRIRLRVEQLSTDGLFAKRLERLLQNDENVTGVRINRASASVTIHYEGEGLSDLDLGLRLLGIFHAASSGESSQNPSPNANCDF